MSPPLDYAAQWSPFRLDALGLLTMLGGPEMSQAVGHLGFHRLTEYLPVLGAYTVPSNDFTKPLSGFTLYNVTDAIVSTSFSGWFSRWLVAQDTAHHGAVFEFKVHPKPTYRWKDTLPAITIGLTVNGVMTAIPILLGDWYGMTTMISIITSILVRAFLVTENRRALDELAKEVTPRKNSDVVKTLCFLADNKVITVYAPRNVIINCFLSTLRPKNPKSYSAVRALGWLSFAVFVVCIGQATLIFQLIAIVITLLTTILTARGTGSDWADVGGSLHVDQRHYLPGRRMETYARLHLSKLEEDTMTAWHLLPGRVNKAWWDEYNEYKDQLTKDEQREREKKRNDTCNESVNSSRESHDTCFENV